MASPSSNFHIKPLTTPQDLEAAKTLFAALASSLGFSISFQGFEHEFASLPGLYQYPTGMLLLAYSPSNHPLGCVAVRPLPRTKPSSPSLPTSSIAPPPPVPSQGDGKRICECKRLYCVPESRGMGIGRALMERAIEEARKLGYEELWLDTLKSMVAANQIYRKGGFGEIERYNDSPLEGQLYFGLKL